jgi:3'-phosphoadenosine 5'-phosphosulfate sulfotransferase (PAPS reductase)/FAD synthetase
MTDQLALWTPPTLGDAILDAHRIYDEAIAEHFQKHTIAGVVILYSGGNDSSVLAHLMRSKATHIGHANTTIGIEATRQFVRDQAAEWGMPLLERFPPETYRELVIKDGFPGPAKHWKMYTRLKERCIEQMQREIITNPHKERVLFLAGRRRAESERRAAIAEHERKGSRVWVSPLANWSNDHMAEYRAMYAVPVNPVTQDLHMSGECLCGAFAAPGELEMVKFFYPGVADEIESIEAEVAAAGHPHPRCRWGWGADEDWRAIERSLDRSGPMCSSCDARFTQLQLITP